MNTRLNGKSRLKSVSLRPVVMALVCLAAVHSARAQFQYPYEYTNSGNGTCTILGYEGPGGAVELPTSINGLTVVSIGDSAFGDTSVTSVEFPFGSSITNIAEAAFEECSSLTYIDIGNNVTSIGDLAFSDCHSLGAVGIPDNLTSIGYESFDSCTSLSNIYIPAGSIGESAFNNCASLTNAILGYGVTSIAEEAFLFCNNLGAVDFPDTITNIGESAFYGDGLTSVTIPASIASIADDTFGDCTSLTNLVLGASVTNIGTYAFGGCAELPAIIIPSSVTSIATNAFAQCFRLNFALFKGNVPADTGTTFSDDFLLTNIYYLPGATGWESTFEGIPAQEFYFNYGISGGSVSIFEYTGPGGAVIIPASIDELPVTSISSAAFAGVNLTSVTIPDSVTSIGYQAFQGCTSLASVRIPGHVTDISDQAFFDCTSLTNVTIPNGVTNIGNSAFSECTSLGSLTIPDSVTSIGNAAFEGCASLGSLTIPNSVTSIGNAAFEGCTGLANVLIGDGVTSIGSYMFYNCTSLASITIPNSVTSIANDAFANCHGLTSVTIGAGVANIGDQAFEYCVNLGQIYFQGNAPGIGSQVFYDDSALTLYYLAGATGWSSPFGGVAAQESLFNYTISNGVITLTGYNGSGGAVAIPASLGGLPVTSIADHLLANNSALTHVTIPGAVTNIGSGVFSNCTGLTGISVDAANSFYSSVTGVLFDKDQTTLIQFPGGGGGSYIIPDGVTSIADAAFYNCAGLTIVIIPDSVSSIGSEAFAGCTGLFSVAIGNGLTSIGDDAFAGCASLVSAYFQGSAPPDLGDAFSGDGSATVYYFAGAGGWGSTFGGVTAELFPFSFTINDGAITITAYGGSDGAVVIPTTISFLPVTSIGDDAFNGNSLTNITIPDSVTSIGDAAFYNCGNLTNVMIPDNVTDIGGQAFFGCASLSNIAIGSGVMSIGNQAISDCTSLAAITVDPANPFFSSANGVLFDENQATLLQFPGGVGGSCTIPDSVTSIGDDAFAYCASLVGVTIPNSVTSIGNYVFQYCASLSDITIPNSVTSIGDSAFANCGSLTNIIIPDSVTSIGNYVFQYCASLPDITIPDSVTTIGEFAFFSCASLTNVIIPASVTSIGYYAFVSCNLASLTIPDSVTSIGGYAFWGSGLSNVTIGAGLTSLGNYAFGSCYNLTYALFLGNAPPDTGDEFDSDFNVVYYLSRTSGWGSYFGEAPTEVFPFVFAVNNGAVTITGYTGPGGAVVIPSAIGLPVTSIGASAFSGAGLTSVTIPNTVTNIGDEAFAGCDSLTNVIFPESVTSIGDQAFGSCASLTSAVFQGNAPPDLGTAFSGDSSATVYYLSGTTGWNPTFGGVTAQLLVEPGFNYTAINGVITITAYTGSNNLVVIPDTIGGLPVTSIGASAFYGSSLVGVTIPSSVTSIGNQAFASCASLISALFEGNAPPDLGTAFSGDSGATVSYLSGTTGWGPAYGGITAAQLQFYYFTDNGALTITGYTGSGGALAIPGAIGGWPVTGIEGYAFYYGSMTSAAIPASVNNIGDAPFFLCTSLTAITVDPANPFFSSANGVLFDKTQDTLIQFPPGAGGSYAIPGSVTTIWTDAFGYCPNLTSVTIPASVTNIEDYAFEESSLDSAFFTGNAPPDLGDAFSGDTNVVYYLPGTTGWGPTFGGAPTVLWNPQATSFSTAGGQFSFTLTGPAGAVAVVEACTNLANPVWLPVSTNILTGGVSSFSDPQSGNYPDRFYRFFPQ